MGRVSDRRGCLIQSTRTEHSLPLTRVPMVEKKLEELISLALEQSPYLARRTIRVENQEGEVVLHGTVKSFFQKQMAQETLKGLHGVRSIDNRLHVDWA